MADLIFIGLSLGCVYALVALGLTLVYRTSGVLNFAQGGFVMATGLAAAWTSGQAGLPAIVAMLAGVAAATAAGLVLAAVIIPLWRRRAAEFEVILATLLFLLAIENLCLNLLGSQPRSLRPLYEGAIRLPGVNVPVQYLVLFAVTLALAYLSRWLLYHSDTGLAMRAVAENPLVARILGI